MFTSRKSDPAQAVHYRSARICTVNGQFFFSTREGTFEGPYFTREEAERDIASYVRRIQQANSISGRML